VEGVYSLVAEVVLIEGKIGIGDVRRGLVTEVPEGVYSLVVGVVLIEGTTSFFGDVRRGILTEGIYVFVAGVVIVEGTTVRDPGVVITEGTVTLVAGVVMVAGDLSLVLGERTRGAGRTVGYVGYVRWITGAELRTTGE